MSVPEIECVFGRSVVVLPAKEHPRKERRFRSIGTTSEGRKAFIVFTWRSREGGQVASPIRLSKEVLEAVRGRAKLASIPYQRFLRMALERVLQDPK